MAVRCFPAAAAAAAPQGALVARVAPFLGVAGAFPNAAGRWRTAAAVRTKNPVVAAGSKATVSAAAAGPLALAAKTRTAAVPCRSR